jgi:hypothetical protein
MYLNSFIVVRCLKGGSGLGLSGLLRGPGNPSKGVDFMVKRPKILCTFDFADKSRLSCESTHVPEAKHNRNDTKRQPEYFRTF